MKEWKTGEVCEVSGYKGTWRFGCYIPTNPSTCIVFREVGGTHLIIGNSNIIEHKTAEEKAAELRAESIENFCSSNWSDYGLMSEGQKAKLRLLIDDWLKALEKHQDINIKEDLCK